jgi:hypothetical protein
MRGSSSVRKAEDSPAGFETGRRFPRQPYCAQSKKMEKVLKYQRWYNSIVDRARKRKLDGYSERHHIRPRSLGGDDRPDNLVVLTYREHFLAHWLLTKFTTGRPARAKMIHALHCMTLQVSGLRLVAGWQIEIAKRALREQSVRRRRLMMSEEDRKSLRSLDRAVSAEDRFARGQSAKELLAANGAEQMRVAGRFFASRRRRKSRPGKRGRDAAKQAAALAA